MRDKFDLQLPRDTREQSKIGTRIDKDELLPGDLVFFKTGSGESGLHVGIYDTNNEFIHASTSRGVMRSSLDNVYWRKTSGRHGEFNLADDINFIVYFNISPVELMTSVVIIYNDITVAFTNVLLLKRACSRPVKSTTLDIGL